MEWLIVIVDLSCIEISNLITSFLTVKTGSKFVILVFQKSLESIRKSMSNVVHLHILLLKSFQIKDMRLTILTSGQQGFCYTQCWLEQFLLKLDQCLSYTS